MNRVLSNRALSCGVALGLGVGMMYLLDPARGRWRRHTLLERALSKMRRLGWRTERWWKDVGNRIHGKSAVAVSWFGDRHAADEVIEARVRSMLGRVADHPHALTVKACGGRVALRGPILAHEVAGVISAVRKVRGVHAVENLLNAGEQTDRLPSLQGGAGSTVFGSRFKFAKEQSMISRNITLPELGLIAGTRAALGAGVGLLLADRLNPDQRRAVGWTLVAVGVLTTLPLAAGVIFGGRKPSAMAERRHGSRMSEPETIGSPS